MPFLNANEQGKLYEDFVAVAMMNITPDAEQDEQLDSDREQEDLEPPSKKAKTGLEMLLCSYTPGLHSILILSYLCK